MPSAGPDTQATVDEVTAWFNWYTSLAGYLPGGANFASNIASLQAAFKHGGIGAIVLKIIGTLLAYMAQVTAGAVCAVGTVKDDPAAGPAMNSLISAAVSDLFGVDISVNQSSGSGNATVDPAATGAAIFAQLTQLFGGLGQIDSAQGAENAKAFLGFGTNFAVVTAFLGFIGGLFPFIHLDELKGFGEEIERCLGIGRLTHTAMTPLVRNLIAQPMDRWVRAQVRADQLSEGSLVKALHAQVFDESTVRQELAEKGYPDEAIDFLIQDLSVKLALGELYDLYLNGDISDTDVVNNLTLTGMPEDQARLELKAQDLARVRTRQASLITWAQTAYLDGFISEENWNTILQNSMLGDLEEQAIRTEQGWKQDTPRKTLTFADVKEAVVANIIPFEYVDQWTTRQGYDSDAQNVLSYQILTAIKTAEHKQAYAQYKAAVLQKAGKPVPPWISDAAKGL